MMMKEDSMSLRQPTSFEKKLYRLLEATPEADLNRAAAKAKDAAIAREVCRERGHCFRFLSMGVDTRVLEMSEGYGGVAARLATRCGAVDTLATGNRAVLSTLRNRNHPNVTVLAALPAKGAYDYILVSDVSAPDLTALLPLLVPGGRLYWAFANPLGLKYWAGCCGAREGMPFSALREAAGTRSQVECMLQTLDIQAYRWYYPYPDHVNPYALYTDDRLPQPGELIYNSFRWERQRAMLFEEGPVWDALLAQERFPEFSNSYLVEVGGESAQAGKLLYAKLSPIRREELRILTRIDREADGSLAVRKEALSPAAQDHMDRMVDMYAQLRRVYDGSGLSINRMEAEGEAVRFEYLTGSTLSEEMLRLLSAEDRTGFLERLGQATDLLLSRATEPFRMTEGFAALFPGLQPPVGLPCAPCTDLDLNFDNIVLTNEGWQAIDFEFSYDFPIPAGFVLYRALHHFFGNHAWLRQDPSLERAALARAGISAAEQRCFRRMEARFQAHVTGAGHPMENMRISRVYLLRGRAVGWRWARLRQWMQRGGARP